jgi:hypothetical protein
MISDIVRGPLTVYAVRDDGARDAIGQMEHALQQKFLATSVVAFKLRPR